MLGAGSWGTAVAVHLAHAGHHVLLWGHHSQSMHDMAHARCNARYLPNIVFPPTLTPTPSLTACLEGADYLFVAVPSHAFAEVLDTLPKPSQGLAWLTKGIHPTNHKLLSELVAEKWGQHYPVAVLTGPSFASEVALGLPTAVTLVSNNPSYQRRLHELLHHKTFRVYLSDDLIGAQVCGAIKNVLAIACGISDGLANGANAKAALITRGLAEMSRLGQCMGARQETFMGLAGVGDLVLTCTDDQSRNRRFGLHIGQGASVVEAETAVKQVVEGKYNAAQVCALAEQFNVDMPICHQVHAILQERLQVKQAFVNLMNRPPSEE